MATETEVESGSYGHTHIFKVKNEPFKIEYIEDPYEDQMLFTIFEGVLLTRDDVWDLKAFIDEYLSHT